VLRSRGFLSITAADFLVRSAYQMGKTPLLPLFAASLGAGDVLLGLIVSVSTLTGMVLKPFVGVLSDRTGRRIWLIIGTAFFAGMPFVYWFVDSPGQLVAVRIVHGMATAIYGPVTLAYVAELSRSNRAERLGWFAMARNSGYIVGPVAAGLMLLTMSPVQVFTVVGLLSSLAFLPVLTLPETSSKNRVRRTSFSSQAIGAMLAAGRSPGVWLAGGMNAQILIAEYAIKAFLPLYADAKGVNIAVVGAYFAVQEGVHLVLAPFGGRLGDRIGHLRTVALGMSAMGIALLTLTIAEGAYALMVPAILIGVAQALVFPSTVALASTTIDEGNLGAGMGLVGTMKNAAKVAGPILGGALIFWFGLQVTLASMGTVLIAGAIGIYLFRRSGLRHTARPLAVTGETALE
jgi:MFS family permease